jgi:uncharacterized protein
MDLILNGTFFNPTKGNLTLRQAIEEIISFMKEDPDTRHELIVGCDSSARIDPTFPLAIVVLKEKKGGRFFLKRIHYHNSRKFYSRQERILEEVMLSCQLALWLRDYLEKRELEEEFLKYEFKYIHADIGENGLTKDMIREVVGMIRGNGFEPRIKPDSFAASSVADRFS